ncbi:MAG: amidophosphoribosyltransferase, partial [Muribaculaceae bacterium]|nr:amidophosphoribosyltransferase [Muribaculaceae bacterium]
IVLLEQLGYALDHEHHRLYREFRNRFTGLRLGEAIEDNLDVARMLSSVAPEWDGGFVIVGATGSGDSFVLRDAHGIRPAFYYADDEVVVVASERPVIQTVMNVSRKKVSELMPGQAIIVGKHGQFSVKRILTEKENARCSFERIYFSRGSDADIYRERKALGYELAGPLSRMINEDFENSVFSFIPNTAEVAFIGMVEGLQERLERNKAAEIMKLSAEGKLSDDAVAGILSRRLRIEKVALKDIKLRTFIAEGASRNDLAAHVYDVTYGCIKNGVDTLVVIDDSIVRGTTLRQSILTMLDRLHPRRIIVVSSSPQVRYLDCYGIDMSRMGEFIAFKAAVQLLKDRGMSRVLEQVYEACKAELAKPEDRRVNAVKGIYAPFTDEEISDKMSEMLGDELDAEVKILFQTVEGLHRAIPGHPGDWYFSGDYPTPGGTTLVNRSYIAWYEGRPDER